MPYFLIYAVKISQVISFISFMNPNFSSTLSPHYFVHKNTSQQDDGFRSKSAADAANSKDSSKQGAKIDNNRFRMIEWQHPDARIEPNWVIHNNVDRK